MIRVSVFYRNGENSRFDMAYYCNKHIPMVRQKLGPACKRIDIDQGLSGMEPGSRPAFLVIVHLIFDSLDEFQKAFAPHAQAIMSDIPNYTDIEPLIQFNEIRM